MKFRVIVADPPWQFSDRLTMSDVKRGAEANYVTLSTAELSKLPIASVMKEDALLALWVPSALIVHGLTVLRDWGFREKQIVTWVKTNKASDGLAFGMGRYFRGCTEHALIGTRGKVSKLVRGKSERNVIMHPALPHSQKPETLQDRLERILPGPYLELFARRDREGWVCVGNECPSTMDVDICDWFARTGKRAA